MKTIFSAIIIAFVFASCSKGGGNDPGTNCTSLNSVRVAVPAAPIAKGQTFNFQTDALSNVTFSWKLPSSAVVTGASGTINSVDFTHEGWFVLTATNTCGQEKKDSFYLDVTVPQEAATCTPPNNQVSYTNASHQTAAFTTISQAAQNPSIPNLFEWTANGSGPGTSELSITFYPGYTNASPPQPGVYTTGTYNGGFPSFSNLDYDKIFVHVITYSPATIVYRAVPGQKVYITRVGGKLKATVCNIPMNGSSNGTPYSTNMTLVVTEP